MRAPTKPQWAVGLKSRQMHKRTVSTSSSLYKVKMALYNARDMGATRPEGVEGVRLGSSSFSQGSKKRVACWLFLLAKSFGSGQCGIK